MSQKPRTTVRKANSRSSKRQPEVAVHDISIEKQAVETPEGPYSPSATLESLAELAAQHPDLLPLVEVVQDLATSAVLAPLSVSTYGARWRQFVRWCRANQLQSCPAEPGTVLLYMAHRAQTKGMATINLDLAAVRNQHLTAGYPNPTDNQFVQRMRQGLGRRLAEQGVVTRKAHPLSLKEVRAMVDCLPQLKIRPAPLTDVARTRLKAILLVSWFTGRRMDEIIRAELSWLDVRDGELHLTSNKQKRMPKGFDTSLKQLSDSAICPASALAQWLDVSNPYRHGVTRLFAKPEINEADDIILVDHVGDGYLRRLAVGMPEGDERFSTQAEFAAFCMGAALSQEYTSILRLIRRWMQFAGVEPESANRQLGGHSMRRGLITELRKARVDIRDVADLVGLKSLELVEEYSDAAPGSSPLDVLDL